MVQREPDLPLTLDRLPLRMDDSGTVRIGNSRVTLDLVVQQYENGMSPEDMVRAYDTLALADVHESIAYYLRHREAVQAYLTERQLAAAPLRENIETDRPRISLAELLARRNSAESTNAPTGH
jgi:uncharacterized protein (DUF433 family)